MSTTVADTAVTAAVVRADDGRLPPGERPFEDPYAEDGRAHAAASLA